MAGSLIEFAGSVSSRSLTDLEARESLSSLPQLKGEEERLDEVLYQSIASKPLLFR